MADNIKGYLDNNKNSGENFDVTVTGLGSDKYGLDVAIGGGAVTLSGLNIAGKVTKVTIDNLGWTAIPASPLANRNAIAIQNNTGQSIWLNYDNTAPLKEGVLMPNGFERQYTITDNIVIYAMSDTSSVDLIVEELS